MKSKTKTPPEPRLLWGEQLQCPRCLYLGYGFTAETGKDGRERVTCPECGVSQVYQPKGKDAEL